MVDKNKIDKQETFTEEEGYIRQNILLSTDCVLQIDALKASSGFSSRGRTIQEVINIFWDIRWTFQMYGPACFEAIRLNQQCGTIITAIVPILGCAAKHTARFPEPNEPNALKAENEYLIKQLALKNIEIERLKDSK